VQIVTNLRQVDVLVVQGRTIGQACKESEITEQSYYRWRNEYGGLEIELAKRSKELERENVRLKWLPPPFHQQCATVIDVAAATVRSVLPGLRFGSVPATCTAPWG
jgi:putative transposase